MTETDTEPTEEPNETDDAPGTDETTDADGVLPGDAGGAFRYLGWAALLVLAVLAVIATFQFYTSASSAITRWVAPDYRPVFRAAFNLAVLLAALAGIVGLARRLA